MSESQVCIQYKGTDLCADIHCSCGAQYHFDGWFCYFVKCMECGAVYRMPAAGRFDPLEAVESVPEWANPVELTEPWNEEAS